MKDETLAAVFEPARLGLLKGATIGVFKFSEIATRLNSDKIYIGARSIESGRLSAGNGRNGTVVEANPCGCVFEVQTEEETGNALSMTAIMCGHPTNDGKQCCTAFVDSQLSVQT